MKVSRLFLCVAMGLMASLPFLTVSPARGETNEELIEMVIELLGNKDKDLRALGLEQVRLEAPKDATTTQRFMAQLSKLQPDAQVGLLSALADRGDALARPAVLDLLNSTPDASVREEAIRAIGVLGEPADVKLLAPLLISELKADKLASRASLVRMMHKDIPAALVAEMKSAQPPIRVELIEILTARNAQYAIGDLLAAAIDADPTVRAAAMTSLGQLANQHHIPGMVQGVLKAKKGAERDAAEKTVMFVCARIPGADVDYEKRAQHLIGAINKLAEADRPLLLSTLGRVGGKAALQFVEAAIASVDPAQHELGLRALCNWPERSVAPRLMEIMQTESSPETRSKLLAALIRVAPLKDERPETQALELLKKAMSLCTTDDQRNAVLKRAYSIRTLDSLRFILPYIDQPTLAEQACESVVELAHHRELRDPNRNVFDPALDRVLQVSKDSTTLERADRYKKGQTWTKPIAMETK